MNRYIFFGVSYFWIAAFAIAIMTHFDEPTCGSDLFVRLATGVFWLPVLIVTILYCWYHAFLEWIRS